VCEVELLATGNSYSENDLKTAKRQVSDYAMAFDSMARISHSDSEKEAIKSILKFFEMLFIPEVLYYVSLRSGIPDQVYSLSELPENEATNKGRIEALKGKYAWTVSQEGFQAKISFQGKDFGILEVDNVKFPEYKEHYLNLTLSITDVCGLAIENARRHRLIKDAEKKLRLEKKKLEQALAEVKTLSGLLPICSYCHKIRDDKGYWNRIEGYIQKHSEAKFSHSICQECAKKYYPYVKFSSYDQTKD
jgi:hypothetical protein